MPILRFCGVFLVVTSISGCGDGFDSDAGGGSAGTSGAGAGVGSGGGGNAGSAGAGGRVASGGSGGVGATAGDGGSGNPGGGTGNAPGGGGVGGAPGTGGTGTGGEPATGGASGSGGVPNVVPGELVTSYGQNGFVLGDVAPGFDFYWEVRDVAIDGNGRAVLAGIKETNGVKDFMVVRYQTSGGLDFSKTDDIGNHEDEANAVAVRNDGAVVLAGVANNGVTNQIGTIRYAANGNIDVSWDGDGKAMTSVGATSRAWDVVTDGNEVVVVGESKLVFGTNDFCVIRFDSLGKPKPSFDGDGIVVVDLGYEDSARAVAVQADGRVVVAGDVGGSSIGVIRLNADGSLDKTFGAQSGKVTASIGSGVTVRGVAVAPDGRIVVAAAYDNDVLVLRLTVSGTLDTSFSSDGKALQDYSASDDPRAVLLDGTGNVLLAGSAGPTTEGVHAALARLGASGSTDLGFGTGGLAIHPLSAQNGERMYAVRELADGYLLAGTQAVAGGVRLLALKVAK